MSISFFDITPFKVFKEQQADFFANASHELKTPLAIISGCVETLQGSAQDDKEATDKFLTLIGEQTARMTGLVQKMLVLTRMQSEQPLKPKERFCLNELLQKVIADFSVRAKTLDKTISFSTLSKLPNLVGDKNEFYHLFQNLVDNALKYGEKKSIIDVVVKLEKRATDKTFLVVSVHNMGNPIPQENLSRIFDKFYRDDAHKKQSVEGSGLGLVIVQQIVQNHHGEITVESSAQQGTTFTVYLPVVP